MFLEKVFEAHFFRTACLKVAKSFTFYTQQTKKTLKYDTDRCVPMALLRLGNTLKMFSQTPLERGQSPLYEHIRIISIG